MQSEGSLNINEKLLEKRGFVEVGLARKNPCKIYYEVYGKGHKKVVFLNGMGADRQMWELLAGYFGALRDFQVVIFDHRGTGYSEDCSILGIITSEMANDTVELLDHLGWDSGINVVGTKSKPAHDCPYETNREFAIAVRIYHFTSLRRSKNTKLHGISTVLGQSLAVFRHHVSQENLVKLGELFKELPETSERNGTDVNEEDREKKIRKRVWIVVGTEDNFIPESDSFYLHKHIGPEASHLEVFEDTGHAVHSQHFFEFSKKIHNFFNTYEL
ncbi:hypothetical protein BB558_007643 [Smittium angustum]|uniref:AB hydrolase-1 domain-containing protein n=1 Tax=Smittium angustum TaxID=133377 RepID=A0A2U1IUH6_SMIAN|nr:hypothetical protein BB558_007643 [Smittium angustum]